MENLPEDFLERLFNIVLVVTGGLISGLIGWYLDNRRRKAEVRAKHFEEKKKKVLEPIRENHRGDALYFNLREGFPFQTSELQKILQDDRCWWDHYSLRTGVDEILYEDLTNHFKHLPKMILEVEETVKKTYPEYIRLLIALYDLIERARLSFLCASTTAK